LLLLFDFYEEKGLSSLAFFKVSHPETTTLSIVSKIFGVLE